MPTKSKQAKPTDALKGILGGAVYPTVSEDDDPMCGLPMVKDTPKETIKRTIIKTKRKLTISTPVEKVLHPVLTITVGSKADATRFNNALRLVVDVGINCMMGWNTVMNKLAGPREKAMMEQVRLVMHNPDIRVWRNATFDSPPGVSTIFPEWDGLRETNKGLKSRIESYRSASTRQHERQLLTEGHQRRTEIERDKLNAALMEKEEEVARLRKSEKKYNAEKATRDATVVELDSGRMNDNLNPHLNI